MKLEKEIRKDLRKVTQELPKLYSKRMIYTAKEKTGYKLGLESVLSGKGIPNISERIKSVSKDWLHLVMCRKCDTIYHREKDLPSCPHNEKNK